MAAMTADLVLDERLLGDLKVHSRTSPLWLWLSRHYDQLIAIGRIGRWRSLCEAATAAGLRNTRGGVLTPAVISRVWSRLKQARARTAGARGADVPQVAERQPAPTGHGGPIERASLSPFPRQEQQWRDVAKHGRPDPTEAPRATAIPPMRAADPPTRSKEEVDAVIRFSGEMARVRFTKSSGYHREAREQQAALVAEAKALGLEHELPPLVFKDGD